MKCPSSNTCQYQRGTIFCNKRWSCRYVRYDTINTKCLPPPPPLLPLWWLSIRWRNSVRSPALSFPVPAYTRPDNTKGSKYLFTREQREQAQHEFPNLFGSQHSRKCKGMQGSTRKQKEVEAITSTKQVQNKCKTSTSTTQVQHKYNTSSKQVQVQHTYLSISFFQCVVTELGQRTTESSNFFSSRTEGVASTDKT